MLSHDQIIDYLLVGQGGISLVHLLCTLFVLHNRFAGFVGIFTSMLYISSVAFTYYGLKQALSRTVFGAILGAGTILLFLSLESAIFWGQYSNCEGLGRRLSGLRGSGLGGINIIADGISGSVFDELAMEQRLLYTTPDCEHTSAMKAVCAFSVFMFLSYILLLGVLMRFKNELLNALPLDGQQQGYAKVPQSSTTTSGRIGSGTGLGSSS